jgi:branched-chain amino acid transport system permease protein
LNLGPRTAAVLGGWGLIGLLAAAAALYSATGGGAREQQVTIMFVYVVVVVGLQIFVGNSGVFSLGHIALAAVGAYTVAILSADPALKEITIENAPFGLVDVQLSVGAALVIAVVVAALFGFVSGLAITRLSGLAAIIVTLALLVIVRNVAINWDELSGGAEGLYGFPTIDSMWWAIAAALLAVTVALLFRESPLGLRLQASREDDLAAAAMGVDIRRSRFAAWILSAAVAGLGGALFALILGTVTPDEFYLHLTLLTLAMLVLGGMASVTGAVLGTVVVYAGSELMADLGEGPVVAGFDLPEIFGLPTLFLGVVILAVMIVRPSGLVNDRELHHLAASVARRLSRGRAAAAAPAPAAAEPAEHQRATLSVTGATKTFQGLTAVNDVSLEVAAGEIVGLIGPNGAGKTTLINTISGVLPLTDGKITLDGDRIDGLPPSRVARRGIARTFQNIRLFGSLSVRDNVAVTAAFAGSGHAETQRHVDALLGRFRLDTGSDRRAKTLAYGQQRDLELARAVALRPSFLLLDEPSAGMNAVETERLRELLRRLRADAGCGIVVVDHDLGFIMALCERVYVMNEGRLISSGTPEEVQRDPGVIKAYLGTRAPASRRGAPRDALS